MRNVEKFAFWFGVANLVLGALSMFAPFVMKPQTKNPVRRLLYRKPSHAGIINTGSGSLFGQLGAVNPPNAIVHSALGAAGVATSRFNNLALPYVGLSALLFAAMAALGWTKVGTKPGIHNVYGFAMDTRGNIVSTVLGMGTLVMAAIPLVQMIRDRAQSAEQQGMDMARAGLTE